MAGQGQDALSEGRILAPVPILRHVPLCNPVVQPYTVIISTL